MTTRVIAGSLRGRLVRTPRRGDEVRPTSSRARTVLFDILGPLSGADTVLDLFAGSGTLGIEALSRGGRHATFVERDRRTVAALRANLHELGLEGRARVIARDAASFLAEGGEGGRGFDLVLADPPYEGADPAEIARLVAGAGVVAAAGRFVLEHAAHRHVPESAGALRLARRRAVGQTVFSFYEPAPRVGAAGERSPKEDHG